MISSVPPTTRTTCLPTLQLLDIMHHIQMQHNQMQLLNSEVITVGLPLISILRLSHLFQSQLLCSPAQLQDLSLRGHSRFLSSNLSLFAQHLHTYLACIQFLPIQLLNLISLKLLCSPSHRGLIQDRNPIQNQL